VTRPVLARVDEAVRSARNPISTHSVALWASRALPGGLTLADARDALITLQAVGRVQQMPWGLWEPRTDIVEITDEAERTYEEGRAARRLREVWEPPFR